MNVNSVGSEQITVDGTTGGVSMTVPTAANKAVITVRTAPIRYLDDSTAPTATLGHVLEPGDRLTYMDADYKKALSQFRAIRTGSTSGVIDVSYYD